MNVDFDLSTSTSPLSFTPITTGTWDTGLWDVAMWGGDFTITQNWQGISGVGYYGAPQMQVSSQGIDVRWVSTDIVYEAGSIL